MVLIGHFTPFTIQRKIKDCSKSVHTFLSSYACNGDLLAMAVGHAVFGCILILVFLDLLGTYEHNTNIRMWPSHPGQNPARIAE